MLALVVSACLTSNPEACADHVIKWVPADAVPSCEVLSQSQVEAWAALHGDVLIKGSRCMKSRGVKTGG